MTTYINVATFTIAEDRDLGISCFGCWYLDHDKPSYSVSLRGVPRLETFDSAHTALLFFNLNLERLQLTAA